MEFIVISIYKPNHYSLFSYWLPRMGIEKLDLMEAQNQVFLDDNETYTIFTGRFKGFDIAGVILNNKTDIVLKNISGNISYSKLETMQQDFVDLHKTFSSIWSGAVCNTPKIKYFQIHSFSLKDLLLQMLDDEYQYFKYIEPEKCSISMYEYKSKVTVKITLVETDGFETDESIEVQIFPANCKNVSISILGIINRLLGM